MPEITIPLPETAVRPAVPLKNFNEIYINQLLVQAAFMSEEDSIIIHYSPFNKVDQEKLSTDNRVLKLPFWATVATVPEAAAVFAAVAVAMPVLIALYEASLVPEPPPLPEPEPEPVVDSPPSPGGSIDAPIDLI